MPHRIEVHSAAPKHLGEINRIIRDEIGHGSS